MQKRPLPIREGAFFTYGSGEDERDLDLDRAVERQHRHADGRARMATGVSEDLAEHETRTVDDAGLAGEVGVDATKPPSRSTPAILSTPPAASAAAARAFNAQVRA